MPDRTPSRIDRDRARSAQRDKGRRAAPEDLSRALGREGRTPWPQTRNERGFRTPQSHDCPECPPSSFNSLMWDGHRSLWVHRLCGFTATQEELEELEEASDDGA